jgi:hypothetical protein
MAIRDRIIKYWLVGLTLTSLQAFGQATVPEPLEPWREWVLYGEEYRACPVMNGARPGETSSHVCAWPGELALDVNVASATFTQNWDLYAEDWVPLPGDQSIWPVNVLVGRTPLPVVQRDGRPAVRLDAGSHQITGSLNWITRPAALTVPRQSGLVSLTLDGLPVARPALDGGQVWLGIQEESVADEDRLTVNVYRRLVDGIPMRLETRIELDVAGQSREVELVGAVLTEFVGQSLSSFLPAQLDADGTLRVQVRPGRWTLELVTRTSTLGADIEVLTATEPWPVDEIWSYQANPQLRIAALEGAGSVDAARSGVPGEWVGLPSYAVSAGQALNVVERSRNDTEDENLLTLSRNLWLDFDGEGFTALDRVTGQMRSGWRLDMAAPYLMTRAEADGEDMLITASPEPGGQGIELRGAQTNVLDTARLLPEARPIPVTGYREAFAQIRTTLHLPPGYRLMAAPGADVVNGAWVDGWRLLDIFLLLVIAAGTWRLLGVLPGVVALFALVLTFHEPGAPTWAWLNLLVVLGVLRVAPEGRLRRVSTWYRNASVAALCLLLIPFVATQIRVVVFPQLEHTRLQRGVYDQYAASPPPGLFSDDIGRLEGDNANAPRVLELVLANVERRAALDEQSSRAFGGSQALLEEVVVTARSNAPGVSRYTPGALVQTGPGLPDWSWNRYDLRWSGPIEADQSYRLLVFGPWRVAAWRVASVLMVMVFLAALIRGQLKFPPNVFGWGSTAAASLLLMVATFLPFASDAQVNGEFPSPQMLDELRNRLSEPAPCHPSCAELTHVLVELEDGSVRLDLELAVQDDVAVPMPGIAGGWSPETISIDGVPTNLLYRSRDGRPWLRLYSGVHAVSLIGAIPNADSFTLPFSLAPRRVEVDAPGWDIAGVNDEKLLSGAIEFIRQQQADVDAEPLASEFPPFVQVVRSFNFDLEWQVTTRVMRISPAEGAFTIPVTLLENESVLTPGIEVTDGVAFIAMAAGQRLVAWESQIPLAGTVALSASENASWTESWRFLVSPIWHAEYAGMPNTPVGQMDPAFFVPEYFPRPGESLTVTLTRPAPSAGDTMAIDSVDYSAEVGERSTRSSLSFDYRSTQGAQHTIRLPGGSELQSVSIDGLTLPLQLNGELLELPIEPGKHRVDLVWTIDGATGAQATLPIVDLGAGSSNLLATLRLPADRWLLHTSGPTMGPAVLYWPELIVFALAAFVLARLRWSPLRIHEWLLLGLGLSTFAWPVLLLFAVWAFAMSWRGRLDIELKPGMFNGLQIGLAVLTVAAMLSILAAIPAGLLGQPDMQVVSPVQFGSLSWFDDQSAGTTPEVAAVSVSLWFYKAAMLAWALWLSFALLRWLPWAWNAFTQGGIWQGKIKAAV